MIIATLGPFIPPKLCFYFYSMLKIIRFAFLLVIPFINCRAQEPQEVRSTTIHSIKFFKRGDQSALPLIPLNSIESLELHFDDFQTSSKSYYYTFQLCDANWQPANLSQMDYIRGFSQNRITQYRFSSISFTRYVHYAINLPQENCMPSRSGNYLLKVFLNGDTSKLAFTRRMLVTQDKVSVAAQVQQPFTQSLFRSHQKITTRVNFESLDIFNPAQQVRVVVMQNNRWDNMQSASNPTFIRGKEFEYSSEDNFIFEGGKEFRWLDLRSFRLQSERVRRIEYLDKAYEVYPVPDTVRSPNRYFYYKDLNGQYFIETLEDINPWWQGDYGTVHFTFIPNGNSDFNHRNIYIVGEMNDWQTSAENAMQWNEEKQLYEKNLLLKNGYYSYAFGTKDGNGPLSFRFTEGLAWDAENQYTVLVYYRAFGARSDELVGTASLNSFVLNNR